MNNEELDKLLRETFALQEEQKLKRAKELAGERVEYDSIHEALSSINFHLTLFLLLIILAALNLPSVIAWARNYKYVLELHANYIYLIFPLFFYRRYSPMLKSDPSFFSSVATLLSLSFLWQMKTPKHM